MLLFLAFLLLYLKNIASCCFLGLLSVMMTSMSFWAFCVVILTLFITVLLWGRWVDSFSFLTYLLFATLNLDHASAISSTPSVRDTDWFVLLPSLPHVALPGNIHWMSQHNMWHVWCYLRDISVSRMRADAKYILFPTSCFSCYTEKHHNILENVEIYAKNENIPAYISIFIRHIKEAIHT